AMMIEDQATYSPRVATRASGLPLVNRVNSYQYPAVPVGWVSFTPADGSAICWPSHGAESCTDDKGTPLPGMPATAPTTSLPFDPATGRYIYKIGATGVPVVAPDPGGIQPDDPQNVRCDENMACVQLRNYRGIIDFSRDIGKRVGFDIPCLNGIFRPGTWCD